MPRQKLSVIIVGGGIGGLTAAIALRRSGHTVSVYEKSSLSQEIGQGITLSPNGGRILKRLGLDFGKARCMNYLGTNVVNAATLEERVPFQDYSKYSSIYGTEMRTAYRVDLHAALVELACGESGEGEPVKLINKAAVESFDGDNGTIKLASGETANADLVIAADGVRSTAAEHIMGESCPELDSSDTIVYRFTLPCERILETPETKQLLDAGVGACTFNTSPAGDRWLVRYWCRDDGLQNFALYALRSYEDAEKQENALRFRTDKASLKKEMEGFHPALLKVADMATDVLPLWRCTTREPLQKLHRGRLVVMGDAAHPVKPHHGQGAISAIEDAAVLGVLFKDVPETEDMVGFVQRRLELFSKLRVGRIAAYKYYSDIPFFRNPVEEQRDKVEKFMKPEELPATLHDLRPWYMRFDAEENARNALDGVVSSENQV